MGSFRSWETGVCLRILHQTASAMLGLTFIVLALGASIATTATPRKVYTATAGNKIAVKEQKKGELASWDGNDAQWGVYVTAIEEQAREWAVDRNNHLTHICEATLNLENYKKLNSMVFLPDNDKHRRGNFHANMVMDGRSYTWTVTSQDIFEDFVNSNLGRRQKHGLCPNVLARKNAKKEADDTEVAVDCRAMDVLEASILYSGFGHQIFIKATSPKQLKNLLTDIKCEKI